MSHICPTSDVDTHFRHKNEGTVLPFSFQELERTSNFVNETVTQNIASEDIGIMRAVNNIWTL